MRIRDGLIAYSTSAIQGDIRKRDGDIAFRRLLGECGVVSLGDDLTNSVGRKWRAAMGKLGFIYPEVKRTLGQDQNLIGPIDRITPAGWNLIRAETVPAMQECYLRAMVTPLTSAGCQTFSPLCWTLAILLELERRGEEPSVRFIEMATIVQTTTPLDGLPETVDRVLALRSRRMAAERKRVFDRTEYNRAADELGCKPHTFNDYADMNMRYLKATGMVQSKGKGIALIPEKRALAVALTGKLLTNEPVIGLYQSLCNGTALPTDHAAVAYQVLEDLLQQIQNHGITYSLTGKPLDTPVQINQVRYEIEELIAEKKEEVYAQGQAEQWEEIAAYMDLIASRKDRIRLSEDLEIRVPRTEAPAYLEWSLWRAFLAIDTLSNKPYEVRRFKIDQDFMPVSTAPGNGPDLIAEFEDYVIVIEVTLSESSRQEAMEGEPVRRHVADLVLQYDKPVYGLFIANRIDSNTAETFRIGVWYTKEDHRMDLHIVPFTLAQFSSFFKAIFTSGTAAPQAVIDLMSECEQYRHTCEAPAWKAAISQVVESRC
ncbi:AlwI family type II restriction endonuclease [Hominifimenecus sp. rT4P-3]|uniref:AlwI family type II restriction endonuclease n=1 Tax=Hominifimenecus sp. rT4P-3 TaxID=3242979 RepID=UPI003DA21A4B